MTHEHHHHHHHETDSTLSFKEKMIKRIEHWLKHNTDHAESYREWSAHLVEAGYPEAADMLAKAAEASLQINELFQGAQQRIENQKP